MIKIKYVIILLILFISIFILSCSRYNNNLDISDIEYSYQFNNQSNISLLYNNDNTRKVSYIDNNINITLIIDKENKSIIAKIEDFTKYSRLTLYNPLYRPVYNNE